MSSIPGRIFSEVIKLRRVTYQIRLNRLITILKKPVKSYSFMCMQAHEKIYIQYYQPPTRPPTTKSYLKYCIIIISLFMKLHVTTVAVKSLFVFEITYLLAKLSCSNQPMANKCPYVYSKRRTTLMFRRFVEPCEIQRRTVCDPTRFRNPPALVEPSAVVHATGALTVKRPPRKGVNPGGITI